jgi:hypothetical protein
MQLDGERLLTMISLAPPLYGGSECVERKRKALAGRIDCTRLGHRRTNALWIRQP